MARITRLTPAQLFKLKWISEHDGGPLAQARGKDTTEVLSMAGFVNVIDGNTFVTPAGFKALEKQRLPQVLHDSLTITSVRLPLGMLEEIDELLVGDLQTRAEFFRRAIAEKIDRTKSGNHE